MCITKRPESNSTCLGLIALVALFAGCVSSKNVSKVPPFSDYVGRTLPLVRPVALIREGMGMWAPAHFPRLRSSPYVMLDFQSPAMGDFHHLEPTDTNYVTVPSGQLVTIECVRDEIAGEAANLIAYGRIVLPDATNKVRFAYPWGHYWHLRAAPWEPGDTPEVRRPPGKLPAHWDYDMFYSSTNAPTWGGRAEKH